MCSSLDFQRGRSIHDYARSPEFIWQLPGNSRGNTKEIFWQNQGFLLGRIHSNRDSWFGSLIAGYATCGVLASWSVIRPDAEAGSLAAPAFPKSRGTPKPREGQANNIKALHWSHILSASADSIIQCCLRTQKCIQLQKSFSKWWYLGCFPLDRMVR